MNRSLCALVLSMLSIVGCAGAATEDAAAGREAYTFGGAVGSPLLSGIYAGTDGKYLRVTTTALERLGVATQAVQWWHGEGTADVTAPGVVVKDLSSGRKLTIAVESFGASKVIATESGPDADAPVTYTRVKISDAFDGSFRSTDGAFTVAITNADADGADITLTGATTSKIHAYWSESWGLTLEADGCGGITYTPGTSLSIAGTDPNAWCSAFAAARDVSWSFPLAKKGN